MDAHLTGRACIYPKRIQKYCIGQFTLLPTKQFVNKYQFWRHDNKPIELWSNKVIDEKIDYIHNNPFEEGYVFRPEDYLYSSAADYAGQKGLLDNVIVVK